jgi:small subunit ribosomal protein S1
VVTLTGMGAFVEIEDEIEGFLSSSEISWTKSAINVKDSVEKGQELKLMILNINPEERKLSLGLKQTLENPWETIDGSYPVGSIHKRPVKKIVKFGMFVELESDKEGDEVEFKILDIKKSEMKISCGIKHLLKSPWEVIKEKYPSRTKVEGTISGITDFGIFIKLEDSVEGLVHISEVSTKRIEDLNDHFEVGSPISAIVLDVNTEKKRLSLSVKHLEMQSEKEELKRILNETSPSTVTLGDMVDLSLKDKENGEN